MITTQRLEKGDFTHDKHELTQNNTTVSINFDSMRDYCMFTCDDNPKSTLDDFTHTHVRL